MIVLTLSQRNDSNEVENEDSDIRPADMGRSDANRDKDEKDINLGREEDELEALEDGQGFGVSAVLGAKDRVTVEEGRGQ